MTTNRASSLAIRDHDVLNAIKRIVPKVLRRSSPWKESSQLLAPIDTPSLNAIVFTQRSVNASKLVKGPWRN